MEARCKELTSTLVTLYATMSRFLASAIRAYGQAIEVDNCERMHTRCIQASSKEHIQNLKQILDDFQAPTLHIDSRMATFCKILESSERLNMLEWISAIQYEETHFFAREGQTSETGGWLLRHERYREWRASSTSMILWLHEDLEFYCIHV